MHTHICMFLCMYVCGDGSSSSSSSSMVVVLVAAEL